MLALTPTLANLATVLRHREMWPEGFEWDYRCCNRCAMGLVCRLGMMKYPSHVDAALIFGIPTSAAMRIFIYQGTQRGLNMDEITPEHVADAIDDYLAKNKGE